MAYDVRGHGKTPVVVVHGLGSSKESWEWLITGLLPICNCRIYGVDLRGHGETTAPDDHLYSLRENAAIVRAFMLDQKLEDVIVIGHSYGGAVALSMAMDTKIKNPRLLRGLILISTPGVFQKFPFIVAQQRLRTYGEIVDHLTTPKARAWLAVHATSDFNSQNTQERVQLYARLWSDPARSRVARETARQFLDGGGLKELAARDHDIGVPTLLIAGKHDHLVGVGPARQLADTIPGANLLVIPNAGHAPQEEVPQSLIPAVLKFLHEYSNTSISHSP